MCICRFLEFGGVRNNRFLDLLYHKKKKNKTKLLKILKAFWIGPGADG